MKTNSTHEPALESEQNVYADVYRLLVAGMVVTNILFVIGLVIALVHPRYFPLSAEWVRSQYHWRTVIHGLAHGNPTSYLMLASLLLIATPVARVMVSIYAFFVDRDYKYVAITGLVLLVILLTIFLGTLGLQ
jgi:uncharacterized membrane protein